MLLEHRWPGSGSGPGDGGELTKSASDAEIVGVDKFSVHFLLFTFDADVCDPVLAAAVGASGDVQLQVLIKARETLFHLFHEPTRKSFGLGDCQLAEFGASAGDRAAAERGCGYEQAGGIQLIGQRSRIVWNVDVQQICMLVVRDHLKRSDRLDSPPPYLFRVDPAA